MDVNGFVQINGSTMCKVMLGGGWREFIDFCGFKAGSAGKRRVKMNSKGTTQDCCFCGRRFGNQFQKGRIDVSAVLFYPEATIQR